MAVGYSSQTPRRAQIGGNVGISPGGGAPPPSMYSPITGQTGHLVRRADGSYYYGYAPQQQQQQQQSGPMSGAPTQPVNPNNTNPGMRAHLPPPVPNVGQQPQVPGAQAPPPVAPIDVNSIMQQWRSIQNPMLPREAEIPHIDSTAAAQAAYGRAKDTAGQQGRGAMDALMDVQGARGIVGSGLGVNEAGGIIGAVNSNLADVNRERLIQDYETELARQTSNAGLRVDQRGQDVTSQGQNNALLNSLINLAQGNQESGLAQRGQNIDVLQGNQSAGLTQRGQNIDVDQGNQGAGVSQRGQNIDLLTTLMRLFPGQQLPFQLG